MSVEDWNKYFKQVFEGAWQCYSLSSDTSYRQWIEKGARWATDFQSKCVDENKTLKQQIKQKDEIIKNLMKAIKRLSLEGEGTSGEKKSSFYDCLPTLQLEYSERRDFAKEVYDEYKGEINE